MRDIARKLAAMAGLASGCHLLRFFASFHAWPANRERGTISRGSIQGHVMMISKREEEEEIVVLFKLGEMC